METSFFEQPVLNSPYAYSFPEPTSGRIAINVINYLGDEVMKVVSVR